MVHLLFFLYVQISNSLNTTSSIFLFFASRSTLTPPCVLSSLLLCNSFIKSFSHVDIICAHFHVRHALTRTPTGITTPPHLHAHMYFLSLSLPQFGGPPLGLQVALRSWLQGRDLHPKRPRKQPFALRVPPRPTRGTGRKERKEERKEGRKEGRNNCGDETLLLYFHERPLLRLLLSVFLSSFFFVVPLQVAQWLVSEMSSQAPADAVRTQNKQQNTPMHFACRGGHLEVCKWLASEVK